MKRLSTLLMPLALLGALAGPARAGDIGVTIAVSQPGLHGQVHLGRGAGWPRPEWQPVLTYQARPVVRYEPYWEAPPAVVYYPAQGRRHAWRHAHHHGHRHHLHDRHHRYERHHRHHPGQYVPHPARDWDRWDD